MQSDTFLKHYISSNVVVNIQATFLSTASKADLIKKIEKLCLHDDPNLLKQLLDHQHTQAHQHPDVTHIQKEKDILTQKLKDKFSSIKNESMFSNRIQHTQI